MKNKKLHLLLTSLLSLTFLLLFNCECEEIQPENGGESYILTGEYNSNITLDNGNIWTLRGTVRFNTGATLTIEPGVTIQGDSSQLSYLIIDRGAKIIAEGTADSPILFTSDLPKRQRSSQDWGGIVINGNASINGGSGTPKKQQGEGESGEYGGDNDSDSSGKLKYVRVEFAGKEFTQDNQLNGIALQGVGSGTVIENVHLHNCYDDGIEMFGGTVNLKNIISTGNGDDQIDCTDGWQGNLVNVFVAPLGGDKGLEFDGNGDDNEAQPLTIVNVSNLIYIDNTNENGNDALRFREGARVNITNAYIVGATRNGINISQATTVINLDNVLIEQSTVSLSVEDSATVNKQTNVTENHTKIATGGFDLSRFSSKKSLFGAGAVGTSALKTTNTDIPVNTDWIGDWTAFPEN